MKRKKKVITQNEKYQTSTFDNMAVGCFFYNNGCLNIKMDNKRYLRVHSTREITEIIEWDKHDFKLAHICDINYNYQPADRRHKNAAIQSSE